MKPPISPTKPRFQPFNANSSAIAPMTRSGQVITPVPRAGPRGTAPKRSRKRATMRCIAASACSSVSVASSLCSTIRSASDFLPSPTCGPRYSSNTVALRTSGSPDCPEPSKDARRRSGRRRARRAARRPRGRGRPAGTSTAARTSVRVYGGSDSTNSVASAVVSATSYARARRGSTTPTYPTTVSPMRSAAVLPGCSDANVPRSTRASTPVARRNSANTSDFSRPNALSPPACIAVSSTVSRGFAFGALANTWPSSKRRYGRTARSRAVNSSSAGVSEKRIQRWSSLSGFTISTGWATGMPLSRQICATLPGCSESESTSV